MLRARGTPRGPGGEADIVADIVADIAADVVVAPAEEAAQAVADVGLPSSIPAFITTNGNGWPPFQIIFFSSFGQNLIFVVFVNFFGF